MDQDIRWQQRYNNYTSILTDLAQHLEIDLGLMKKIDKIAGVKMFELTFELLWKLLKDYLVHENIDLGIISPLNILRTAASSHVLEIADINGDVLVQCHKTRNELVHVYDEEMFEKALATIKTEFLEELVKIDDYFRKILHH